jgi:predicted amidohydrolase
MKNFFTKLFKIFTFQKKDKTKNVTGIKFDYSEDDLSVYFEVADKKLAEEILLDISYIKNIKNLKHGFVLDICAQQIPEIVSSLLAVNIPIYAVIPQKNNL